MIAHFYQKALDGVFDIKICNDINDFVKQVNDKNFSKINTSYIYIINVLDSIKNLAKSADIMDKLLANSTFILKQLVRFFYSYSHFIESIDADNFKSSWIYLQDCLDLLECITKYEENKMYDFLQDHLENIEKLYPYKAFISMEAKITAKKCSLCGKSMIKSDCEHIRGELYWGDVATAIVEKIEKLYALALVSTPKDKRCVIELPDEQCPSEEKYKRLIFCKPILTIPFLCFDLQETEKEEFDDAGKLFKHPHLIIKPTGQMMINIFKGCPSNAT